MFQTTTNLLLASGLLLTSTNSEPAPIRINCGSSSSVDVDDVTFEPDRNFFGWFDGAGSTTNDIDPLFQTFRDAWWPGVSYTFDIDSSGEYIINLFFAEVEKTGPNQRTFDILLNGVVVELDFDIFIEAGGENIPLVKTYELTVSENNLEIIINLRRNLQGSIDLALISGIEIIAVDTTPVTNWFTLTDCPYALGELATAAVDDQGYYVFGGNPSEEEGLGFWFTRVTYYDIATQSWTDTSDDTQFFSQADHQTPQVYNGLIYSFGGGNFIVGNFMRSYDPTTTVWTQLAELVIGTQPWLCLSPSSALIGDKIYIAGGIVNDLTVDNVIEYDILTDTWTEKTPMPDGGRNHAAGIGYNGLFYMFGGRQGGNFPQDGFTDSFVYDPITDSWSTLAPMPIGTGGGGQAVEMNGKLIVIGGETCCVTIAAVQSYDPITDTWELLTDMITPRHGVAPVVIGNAIYVVGGGPNVGFSQSTTHEVLVFE